MINPRLDQVERGAHRYRLACEDPRGLAIVGHDRATSMNRQRCRHRLTFIDILSQIDKGEEFCFVRRPDHRQDSPSYERPEVDRLSFLRVFPTSTTEHVLRLPFDDIGNGDRAINGAQNVLHPARRVEIDNGTGVEESERRPGRKHGTFQPAPTSAVLRSSGTCCHSPSSDCCA